MRRRLTLLLAAGVLAAGGLSLRTPPPAQALSVSSVACKVAGVFSGLAGTLCSAASKGVGLLKGAGVTAHAVRAASAAAVIAGVVIWVTTGARRLLADTANVINLTTRPQLESSWFSASRPRIRSRSTSSGR